MTLYLWIKVLHVLAIISWMAGLLYLPRLFVYHAGESKGGATSNLFEIMEYRLLRFIMNPAMIVAWASGLWLAYQAGYFLRGWFLVKLGFVVAMTAFHMFLARERRLIADEGLRRNARYYRIVNEIPTLIMIVVVTMVVLKPFH
ncbi:MAG: protoporphyrinogen oxidase HemJ [Alphaproteobacteria bacterium]|nr:protoporphyrinogen oxidase HemJ [Alphaproteobacteria bacterium]